jgi:hypothetical protein
MQAEKDQNHEEHEAKKKKLKTALPTTDTHGVLDRTAAVAT